MKDEYLSKEKFVEILREFNIPMNEGISADKVLESGMYPKLTFWAYYYDFIVASNEVLKVIDTYQVSIFSDDDNFFRKMLPVLARNKLFSHIEREYLNEYRCWHFYFSIDVVDDIITEEMI